MQDSLLYVILILIGIVIYLLISQRKNKVEPKDHSQEINNLKDLDQIETAVQTENVEKFVNNQ